MAYAWVASLPLYSRSQELESQTQSYRSKVVAVLADLVGKLSFIQSIFWGHIRSGNHPPPSRWSALAPAPREPTVPFLPRPGPPSHTLRLLPGRLLSLGRVQARTGETRGAAGRPSGGQSLSSPGPLSDPVPLGTPGPSRAYSAGTPLPP